MKNVRVTYHREDGSWWAESPDLEGFSAAADSLGELRLLVSEGAEFATGDAVRLFEYQADGAAVDAKTVYCASVGSRAWWSTALGVAQGEAVFSSGRTAHVGNHTPEYELA